MKHTSFFLAFLSILCLCTVGALAALQDTKQAFAGDFSHDPLWDFSAPHDQDPSVLSLEKLSWLLKSIPDQAKRESIALDLLSLLFESEDKVVEMFPSFRDQLGLETKSQVLNEFVNRFLVDVVKKERLETEFSSGFPLASQLATVGNNGNHCVSCITLHNLDLIMCNQNYPPIIPGICVQCSFLRKITTLMCSLNCSYVTLPSNSIGSILDAPLNGLKPPPKEDSAPLTQTVACVKCLSLYYSIEMICGPPNCTNSGGGYYGVYEQASEREAWGDRAPFKVASRGLNTRIDPNNCIPCYYQYVAYELVCGDLLSYCPPNPSASPTPMPSPTPAPSSTNTASATPAPSTTASATPAPPPPSATPSPSSYYWYYWYNAQPKE